MFNTILLYFSITDPKSDPKIEVNSWWTVDENEERWVIIESIENSRLVHFVEHHGYLEPVKKVLPWSEFLYQHSPFKIYNHD